MEGTPLRGGRGIGAPILEGGVTFFVAPFLGAGFVLFVCLFAVTDGVCAHEPNCVVNILAERKQTPSREMKLRCW